MQILCDLEHLTNEVEPFLQTLLSLQLIVSKHIPIIWAGSKGMHCFSLYFFLFLRNGAHSQLVCVLGKCLPPHFLISFASDSVKADGVFMSFVAK